MVTVINESKTLTFTYDANKSVSLMVENLIRIKSGITINGSVSAKIKKTIMSVKEIIFGILLHVHVRAVNI